MKQADTYFVLDFDRCIGDTDKARQILWSVCENETAITAQELQSAKDAMEAKGYTFDVVGYVAKQLVHQKSEKTWQDIRRVYVAVAKLQGILEPYVDEFLEACETRHIPYGVLTYGKEPWQLTKLEAAGLFDRHVPFEVTQIERKGTLLSGWKHGDGFIVPPALTRDFQPLKVKEIVFLDDKPRSFIGIPSGVRGICVRPTSYAPLPSQQGELPAGVREVQGLRGAIELLFA